MPHNRLIVTPAASAGATALPRTNANLAASGGADKASASNPIKPTRRMFMSATVASVASASIASPSIAAGAPAITAALPAQSYERPDPILAAITRCQEAERECNRRADIFHDDNSDAPEYRQAIDASIAARLALAETAPTTFAGLATLISFVNQSSAAMETSFFDEEMGELLPFFASLDRSITVLSSQSALSNTTDSRQHDKGRGNDARLLELGAALEPKIAASIAAIQASDEAYAAHYERGEISRVEFEKFEHADDAALEEVDDLSKQIRTLRATTLKGMRVKARLAAFHRWRNQYPLDGGEFDDEVIGTNLIEDLLADDPAPIPLPAPRPFEKEQLEALREISEGDDARAAAARQHLKANQKAA